MPSNPCSAPCMAGPSAAASADVGGHGQRAMAVPGPVHWECVSGQGSLAWLTSGSECGFSLGTVMERGGHLLAEIGARAGLAEIGARAGLPEC